MTDSDMVDLYEEMLWVKATNSRIRPMLYVSSSRDLECNVLMLLNAAPELRLARHGHLIVSGPRQQIRTI
ncbi:MAG TPA: hypothetical protein VN937_23135 [Blastocatellia bacterium]|nr:hypothetical protein [Blastocatellia bacterium]